MTPITGVMQELQVAGFPDRNPPLSDGVTASIPSRGILMYPQKNYLADYRPSIVDGDLSAYGQPNYAAYAGDRIYVRCFDLAFSRSAVPLTEAIGSSIFKIRIYGLKLVDFAWSGGAEVGNDNIALLVKLAGLTTWMDLGRPDGSGPSKQDAFQDGAGCQIIDTTETVEGRDKDSGIWYSDVLVHTGTSASIYENSYGEAPLLFKAIIKDSVGGKALNFEQGGADGTVSDCRGLVGVEIIRPE